ncbi:MAG: hypothetical protein FJY80_01495 [Candidatus Aminicenantes bacterium]|nr:hypothetical protein [Candidatus Aminicenantes bacterium]MBM3310162.1 hypothetical protein [Candidatus Aminicenantes bacterium]
MKRIRPYAGAVAVMAFVSTACIIPVYIDDPRGFPRRLPEMFEKTVPWEGGGAIAVENPVGDVEIFGWDRREVRISAEWGWSGPRGSRFGERTGPPEVEIDEHPGVLRVVLRPVGRETDPVRPVRLILNVPRAVDLESVVVGHGRVNVGDVYGRSRLAVQAGEVRVENYSGSLEVMVERGTAEAEILDFRPEDVVRLVARQGSVTLYLEDDANAEVEAEAPGGRIVSDFDLGPDRGGGKTSAEIGREKGGSVVLISGTGDVRIRKVREGF